MPVACAGGEANLRTQKAGRSLSKHSCGLCRLSESLRMWFREQQLPLMSGTIHSASLRVSATGRPEGHLWPHLRGNLSSPVTSLPLGPSFVITNRVQASLQRGLGDQGTGRGWGWGALSLPALLAQPPSLFLSQAWGFTTGYSYSRSFSLYPHRCSGSQLSIQPPPVSFHLCRTYRRRIKKVGGK